MFEFGEQISKRININSILNIGECCPINAKYGVKIEKNALVEVYSFVNKNIPDNIIAFGVPVEIKKKR